jgi:hypothetical protein
MIKSPQAVFDELCEVIFEKFLALNFSRKGRLKLVRKCALGNACINIRKSVATTKNRVRFTVDLNIFVNALDWINRNPENYWEKGRPDMQIGLYEFFPKNAQTNDWWDVEDESDGQSFVSQVSADLLESIAKYVEIYESLDSVLALWLSYVNSGKAKIMTKIEYAGLLYGFDRKMEGQKFLEDLLHAIKDDQDRRLVVRYIEKFSKKFY